MNNPQTHFHIWDYMYINLLKNSSTGQQFFLNTRNGVQTRPFARFHIVLTPLKPNLPTGI